jgi:hypothetical protein
MLGRTIPIFSTWEKLAKLNNLTQNFKALNINRYLFFGFAKTNGAKY